MSTPCPDGKRGRGSETMPHVDELRKRVSAITPYVGSKKGKKASEAMFSWEEKRRKV